MRAIPLLALIFLASCGIAEQRGQQESGPQPITIHVPEAPKGPDVDAVRKEFKGDVENARKEMKNDITANAANANSQMTGLVNTSAAQLTNKFTGLEAELRDLVHVSTTANATANVEFNTKLQSAIKVLDDLKIDVKNTVNLVTQLQIKVTGIENLEIKVRDLEQKAVAAAQVGLKNEQKIEDIKSEAGRDLTQNYFPKEAADTIERNLIIFLVIIMLLIFAAGYAMYLTFVSGRDREHLQFKEADNERKELHALLMKTLTMLPEHQGSTLRKMFEQHGVDPTKASPES